MSEAPVQDSSRGRRPLRRGLRAFLLVVLLVYLGILLVFARFQRSLIYIPTRTALAIADSNLPAGQVHDVAVPVNDDLTLHGWLILAAGHTAAADRLHDALQSDRPFVLLFPGNAGHRGLRMKQFELLTGIGCDVLLVDYRGYAENEGTPSEAFLVNDGLRVWEYVVERLDVPPERIVVLGESLGGGVACQVVADRCRAGQSPAGLILRATFSSLIDAGAYHYPILPVRLMLIDRFESDAAIKEIDCPILQFHGEQDTIVPHSLGKKLFDAAQEESASGVAKRFVSLPAAGHNDIFTVASDTVRDEIRAFLQRLGFPTSE